MIPGRSPIVQLSIQAATPLALVLAVFTLLVGHNRPGGGFAAGLLLGAVVVLRTIAGLSHPRSAVTLLCAGGLISGLTALAPIMWGAPALDQLVVNFNVPVLGTIKSGTALIFDLGVMAIVVGFVVAMTRGLDAAELSVPTAPPPEARASTGLQTEQERRGASSSRRDDDVGWHPLGRATPRSDNDVVAVRRKSALWRPMKTGRRSGKQAPR